MAVASKSPLLRMVVGRDREAAHEAAAGDDHHVRDPIREADRDRDLTHVITNAEAVHVRPGAPAPNRDRVRAPPVAAAAVAHRHNRVNNENREFGILRWKNN